MTTKLILASTSSYRRTLLQQLGLPSAINTLFPVSIFRKRSYSKFASRARVRARDGAYADGITRSVDELTLPVMYGADLMLGATSVAVEIVPISAPYRGAATVARRRRLNSAPNVEISHFQRLSSRCQACETTTMSR